SLTSRDCGYESVVHDLPNSEPDVSLQFDHERSAVSAARRAIMPILREDGKFAEDVELTTSELVSNVVEHTDDGGRLQAWDDDPLVLQVEDYERQVPTIPQSATDVGGRGLSIVERLANDWGTEPTDTGKVVWARFQRPRAPADPNSELGG